MKKIFTIWPNEITKQSLLILITFVLSWAFSAPAWAQQLILSEYAAVFPGQQSRQILWRFNEVATESEERILEISDYAEKLDLQAKLKFDAQSRLCRVLVQRGEQSAERNYDPAKPVLVNHCLLPVDWLNRVLPFTASGTTYEFEIVEKIGNTGFVDLITVSETGISIAEAINSGWLRQSEQNGLLHSSLSLIEVSRRKKDGSQVPLLRQLWQQGDVFWLAEEKENRRSWRLPAEATD